jgi:hypothetical protein
MPGIREAHLRHARYYLHIVETSEQLFLRGGEDLTAGLTLFDQERVQIDRGWQWGREHVAIADPAIDELLLEYADATVNIGDLR